MFYFLKSHVSKNHLVIGQPCPPKKKKLASRLLLPHFFFLVVVHLLTSVEQLFPELTMYGIVLGLLPTDGA